MKKLQTFSFHLHWITLCCFLLPFFYDSCTDKKTEESVADTTAVVTPIIEDSIPLKCLPLDTANTISADISAETSEKDEISSKKIVKKYPLLGLILMPNTNTYTGLATIINTMPFVRLSATAITFILLVIGLLAKLIDKNALKILLILEIFSFLFLFFAYPPLLVYDLLWGYWLCLFCISTLIITDVYIVYKQKREEI